MFVVFLIVIYFTCIAYILYISLTVTLGFNLELQTILRSRGEAAAVEGDKKVRREVGR